MLSKLPRRKNPGLIRPRDSAGQSDTVLCSLQLFVALGWAVAWLAGGVWLGLLAALFGTGVVVWWACFKLTRALPLLRLLQLGSVALTAIMNLGFLLAWAVATTGVSVSFAVLLTETHGIPISDYSRAVCFTQLFAFSLSLFSRIQFFVIRERQLLHSMRQIVAGPVLLLFAISAFVIILEVALVGLGVIGYRSFQVEGFAEGEIPWYYNFIDAFKALQIPLNVYFILRAFRTGNWLWLIWGIVGGGAALFIAFTGGRSGLILAVIMHLFYWIVFTPRNILRFRIGLVLVVLLVGAYPFTVFNNFIRSSASGVDGARSRDLGAVLSEAAESYGYDDSQATAKEATARNLATRPLVAHPLAIVQNVPASNARWGYGREYLNAFIWTIPRMMFPSKFSYAVQEGFIYQYFGVYFSDTADSVYLSGYLNFGWVGWLLGAVPICGLWLSVLLFISFLRTDFARLVLLAQWPAMFIAGVGEGSLISWFVAFRLTVVVFVVCVVLEALFVGREHVSAALSVRSGGRR